MANKEASAAAVMANKEAEEAAANDLDDKVLYAVAVVHRAKAAETVDEGHPPVPQGKMRLSQETIDAILAEKTRPYPSELLEYYRNLKGNPSYPPDMYQETWRLALNCVKTHDRVQMIILERQAWIYDELKEKGYVDIDEDKVANFTAVHWKEELRTYDEEEYGEDSDEESSSEEDFDDDSDDEGDVDSDTEDDDDEELSDDEHVEHDDEDDDHDEPSDNEEVAAK